MSATTRIAVNSFWEYAAFVVNSLVFLLIGIQVNLGLLEKNAALIGWAILATLAARIIVVYGLSPFMSNPRLPIPAAWRHLLFWGGLRGALCMAMALSLPFDYPLRESIIVTTFGVVLFTLLVPGLSLEPLVKALKLRPSDPQRDQYQALRGKRLLERDALHELKELKSCSKISDKNFELLAAETNQRLTSIEEQIEALHIADTSIEELQLQEARRHLLESRKDKLNRLGREGLINEEKLHKIKLDLDRELEESLTNVPDAFLTNPSDDKKSLD